MANTDIRLPSGTKAPIVRYVYLVNDASDALRMGGVSNNTYTNAQLAFNAALAIVTANPTFNVVLQVGVTTAAGVGGITMSTINPMNNISIVGLSSKLSVIGDINVTTSSLTSDRARIKNMTTGNILNPGNGNLFLQIQDSTVGSLTASVGNVIFLYDCYDSRIGDITLSTVLPTSTAGLQLLNCGGLYINSLTGTVNANVVVNTLVGAPGSQSGNDHPTITFGAVSMTGLLRPVGSEFRNCEFISTFTFTNTATGGGTSFLLNFDNCKFQGAVSLTANSAIVANTANCNITNCTFLAGLTFAGLRMIPKLSFTTLNSITNLSASAFMMNCVFFTTQVATPLINGIGTGCIIDNTTFIGGSTAIDNPSIVKVKVTNSNLQNRVGANIWVFFEDTINSTVTTLAAAVTLAQTIPIPLNSVLLITSNITSRKTAGLGVGVIGDGNGYIRTVKAKNVAGVVTIGTIQSSFTSEDILPFNATFAVSGTNILVNVTGAVNDTVDWNVTSKIYS